MLSIRRLLVFSACLIGLVVLGTQALSMLAAHRYLHGQLAQQSQGGAQALAWALSHAPGDARRRATLADELFGQGAYALVRITNERGATDIERSAPPPDAGDGADEWVEHWLMPEAPESSQPFVSDDGRFRGMVTVRADAHTARETLWQGGLRVVGLALAAAVCWLLFATELLKWLDKRAPRTSLFSGWPGEAAVRPDAAAQTEAQRVAAAIEAQNARIESLQSEVYRDAITRLPNRRYFVEQFRAALADAASAGAGHILMFRQRDLAQINRHLSRAFTDQWLRASAERLRRLVAAHGGPSATLARISGSDFVLLMPGSTAPQASLLAERVRRELRALRVPMDGHSWCRWALAIADFSPGDGMSEILAGLDHALMCAESADDDQVTPASQAPQGSRIGEYSWHDALLTALDQHRFSLAARPLHDIGGTLLQYEGCLTLHDQSGTPPVPASVFMPPAVRLGLSAECDIQAVRLGLDWLVTHAETLAVPIALASLSQDTFLPRLRRMLADRPDVARRLILEMDASGLAANETETQQLCEIVTGAGARLGAARLSQDFGAMEHLHEYPLAYVKLCGRFVAGIVQSPGSQQLAVTVVAMARTLGMDVYADDVPDDAAAEVLKRIGVRALNGPVVNSGRGCDLALDHRWISS